MIIIKYYNLYVPLNQNTNSFRHYGIKFDKILFFELHELFHVISSEMKKDYPPYIKAYYEMKQKYNLLRNNNDMSIIVPFNGHLYNELLSTNKYAIDKFILKNSAVVEWEDLLKTASNRLTKKEIPLYKIVKDKLEKHESYFKKISDFIIDNSRVINLPTNKIAYDNSVALFNIIEDFDNFTIKFPSIDNTSNYLKSQTKINSDINFLEYLRFSIYHCRSDFNRNKDKPFTDIVFINKYVKIKDMIDNLKNKVVCVISNNEYVILNINEIQLNTNISENHKKKRKY